jgi:DNA-binding transcriptional LysR family regulator
LCLAARAADLDIFGQGLILRDSSGWQITPEGRTFLDWLEAVLHPRMCSVAEASPPAPEPPPLLLVGVPRGNG